MLQLIPETPAARDPLLSAVVVKLKKATAAV
jgi:hypothetical protein